MNEDNLFNYPFLRSLALDYYPELKTSLEDFLENNREYLEKAGSIINRILENKNVDPVEIRSPRDRVLLYISAKMLLTYIGDYFVSARYALWERRNLYEAMRNEEFGVLTEISKELGIDLQPHNDNYALPISSFLKYSTVFNEKDLNLCNQLIEKGYVLVNLDVLRKIIREAFYSQFLDDVSKPVEFPDEVRKILEEYSKPIIASSIEIRRELSDLGPRNIKAFPPCMVKILDDISKNANLSHPARFYMVTFLHKVGYENDEIIKMFGKVPDFAEKITKYQVEHITGKGRGREYQVPSCQTLGSLGLCYKESDDLCMSGKIKHPLQYYRIKNSSGK